MAISRTPIEEGFSLPSRHVPRIVPGMQTRATIAAAFPLPLGGLLLLIGL
jgi:hypothetical protein